MSTRLLLTPASPSSLPDSFFFKIFKTGAIDTLHSCLAPNIQHSRHAGQGTPGWPGLHRHAATLRAKLPCPTRSSPPLQQVPWSGIEHPKPTRPSPSTQPARYLASCWISETVRSNGRRYITFTCSQFRDLRPQLCSVLQTHAFQARSCNKPLVRSGFVFARPIHSNYPGNLYEHSRQVD